MKDDVMMPEGEDEMVWENAGRKAEGDVVQGKAGMRAEGDAVRGNAGMKAEGDVVQENAGRKAEGDAVQGNAGMKAEAPGHVTRRCRNLNEMEKDFGFFGVLSVLYGIGASFCLYRNPLGITVPLFVAASYVAMFLVFKRLKMAVKRESLFLAGVSLLIGLSSCFTANMAVGYHMNRLALWLLFCIFILHQFHEDARWNIGKYVVSILVFLVDALTMIGCPFVHLVHFVKSIRNSRYKTALRLLAGICAAVPAIIILCILLASADMVFQNMLLHILIKFMNPVTIFLITFQALAWAVTLYCLVCSARAGDISDDIPNRRVHSPVAAISFMSMIGFIYLVFSGIQIVYLFMGKGSLPLGMTYSDYARQGFFQLLFVVVLNLVMVLLCLKHCREHVVLKAALLVISLCTYVMIASAVYRMVLYVQQYNLTFLRVLVLWFLAMVSILMVGVVMLIFRSTFPLFGFCLGVISVFYLGFAWMKPDYMIAKYNVEHMADQGEAEIEYLESLSGDAAPAVMGIPDSQVRDRLLTGYVYKYGLESMGLRTLNFSVLKCNILKEENHVMKFSN